MKRRAFLTTSFVALSLPAFAAAEAVSQDQAFAALAREAYVYVYPMVENYLSLYQYAIDQGSSEYKGPINHVSNVARVFTPDDTGVVTPNSDTPYSFLVMDLRAEPLVITLPEIEADRYYSVQLIDLYSHNTGYLGTRVDGNGGGSFLIAGPGWQGEPPAGVTRVVRMDTELALGLFRTQLFSPEDIDRVRAIQAGYDARPLSAFAGTAAPAAAAEVDWPAISRDSMESDFWSYANFLLQFAPPLSWENDLRESFALLGVAPAPAWPATDLTEERRALVRKAGGEAFAEIAARVAKLTGADSLFGTPEMMRGRYMERAMGAMGGLYGNTAVEAQYPSYMVDASGQPLNSATSNYVLRFPKGQLPPVGAFWSITMYDAQSRFLVRNPLNRYLINSAMLKTLKVEENGDIVLYLQRDNPGGDRASNWLPAPDGPMAVVMRLYLPQPQALDGTWQPPAIEKAP